MLFQRINRSDPEKVFMVVKAGEALVANRPVALHFSGTDDGLIGFTADAASDATAVIGIADTAVAIGEYGLVQCYGFRSAAIALGASNFSVGQHDVLCVMSASSGGLSQSVSIGAASNVQPNFVAAGSASSALSAGYRDMAIFIRCL